MTRRFQRGARVAHDVEARRHEQAVGMFLCNALRVSLGEHVAKLHQRAGLVGAEGIRGAEVFVCRLTAINNTRLRHPPRSGCHRHTYIGRQEFRRQTHGQRHGETQAVDHQALQQQVGPTVS